MQNILADNFPQKADINIGPNVNNYRTIGNGQGYFIILGNTGSSKSGTLHVSVDDFIIYQAVLNIFGADAINDLIESTLDSQIKSHREQVKVQYKNYRIDFKSILKYAYIDGESKIINSTMFGKVSKINRT